MKTITHLIIPNTPQNNLLTPQNTNKTLQITKYKLLALICGRRRPLAYRGHEKISSTREPSSLTLTFTNCTRIIALLSYGIKSFSPMPMMVMISFLVMLLSGKINSSDQTQLISAVLSIEICSTCVSWNFRQPHDFMVVLMLSEKMFVHSRILGRLNISSVTVLGWHN